jgi:glycosyltransferase involved in cell wall biosynthesis
MDISIIIPLYDESESVKLIGDQLFAELSKTGKSFEIILVLLYYLETLFGKVSKKKRSINPTILIK